MKQLVDYDKLSDYLIERREAHINAFTDFRYAYGKDKLTIDDVIYEARSAKELGEITDKISSMTPPMDELRKVYNALKNLSSLDVKAVAFDYKDEIKAIADFLGIDINDFKQDDEE